MKKVQLTRSRHIVPYANFLTAAGEPVGRLLQMAGLPSRCLEDPQTTVPTVALWRFRELAAIRTGLPNLTLEVTEDLEFSELGAIADAVLCKPTLLAMVQVFQGLVKSESSTPTLVVQACADGGIYFADRLALRHVRGEWHAELYVLSWMLKIVQLIEPAWTPSEISCVSKATPERVSAIESLGATPRFNECCTAFKIPASMVALPPKCGGKVRGGVNVEGADLWASAPASSFSGAVKQLIRAYVKDGWLSAPEASEVAGASLRTMQRRLSAESTTYSDLLEEVRAELAGDLLDNSNLRVSEISVHLGYGEIGNFTRAFCRWSGVTPTAFRAQRREKRG